MRCRDGDDLVSVERLTGGGRFRRRRPVARWPLVHRPCAGGLGLTTTACPPRHSPPVRPLLLIYTSGTTGIRGVRTVARLLPRHSNLLTRSIRAHRRWLFCPYHLPLGRDDRTIGPALWLGARRCDRAVQRVALLADCGATASPSRLHGRTLTSSQAGRPGDADNPARLGWAAMPASRTIRGALSA